MKTLKLGKEDSKVTRKLITKFGEMVYGYSEVVSVGIKVDFKDGSSIAFRRDEEEDSFDRMIKGEDELG